MARKALVNINPVTVWGLFLFSPLNELNISFCIYFHVCVKQSLHKHQAMEKVFKLFLISPKHLLSHGVL